MGDLGNWLLGQDGVWVYVVLAALLLGGAIGLPIPEDVPLLLGGVLVEQGKAQLDLVFIVSYSAVVLGDLLIYSVGRRFGPRLFKTRLFCHRITPERAELINKRLERHSLWMIFIARHLFYLRTATFLTCGAFKMNFRRFLVADALAAFVSAPLMIGLGYLLSENFSHLLELTRKAKTFSIIIGLLIVTGVFLFWRKKRAENLSDTPGAG
jgi:membrane protein DedA with SNARE-associated domain